jgi:hypothetical protein
MRRLLLTEDPGIRQMGVACFDLDAAELLVATHIKNPCKKGNKAAECRALGAAARYWYFQDVEPKLYERQAVKLVQLGVEWPQMLAPGQQKGDQNDLPALAAVSTAFAAAFPEVPVESVLPREWKGTIDPDAMTMRIHGRLSEVELSRIEWVSSSRDPLKGNIMHNVFDAIGIGLHMLGRLDRRRVYCIEE